MTQPALKTGWERIECPVCAGVTFTHLFDKSEQPFVRCDGCTLVLINPRPRFEEIVGIYEADYSQRYVDKRERKLWRARRRVRQMRRYVRGGRWLDIGCSACFILEAARTAGFEVYGSDVDPTGLEYGRREFGLVNLHHGFFEEAGCQPGFFDVITLYDVIEHVADLNRTVEELARVLAPDGIIEVWTPDVGHWRRPQPLQSWNAIMPSKHLYYFDQHTLDRLVSRHGLRIIRRRLTWKPGLRIYLKHMK